MSDDELRHFIQELRTQLPDVGETLVIGRLRSLGYHIARERVRQCIRSTDPLNAALRWHGVTLRRPYSVPGPNSLWHIGEHWVVGGDVKTVKYVKLAKNLLYSFVNVVYVLLFHYFTVEPVITDSAEKETLYVRLFYKGHCSRSQNITIHIH